MSGAEASQALWDGIRLTLEAAPIAMLLVARDGSIHLANQAACGLVGCTAGELLFTAVEDLVPMAARGEHAGWRHGYQTAPTRRTMGTGRDLALQRLDGTTVPVEVGLNPMDVAGEPFVVCSVLDLSERVRTEKDRAQLEMQAAEADRLRSLEILAGGVAHDFNNMLVSVLGNASMVRSALDPDSELVDWVLDIERGAARAAELAKQMLAFSGGGRFVVESTDLAGLLRSFAPILRSLVPRTVALRTWLDDAVPLAEVDRGQIRQVITNLVGNAAAAMVDGTGTIGLRTAAYTMTADMYEQGSWRGHRFEGPAVAIEVSDDGPGIAAETLPRIFEPFFTTRTEGHGMGLAAVLGIVRAHGGAVSVYSVLGEGTTFKVSLPAPEQSARSHEDPAAQPSPARRILVIDDEDGVIRFVRRCLSRNGFDVVSETSPSAGIDTYRALHETIDLVLLDLSMPDIDGRAVYREITRINPKANVLIMSGFSEKEIEIRFAGRPIGALTKPFAVERLLEAVQDALP